MLFMQGVSNSNPLLHAWNVHETLVRISACVITRSVLNDFVGALYLGCRSVKKNSWSDATVRYLDQAQC